MSGQLRFEVLGPVRAWRGDDEVKLGPPQQRAILGILLLRIGAPASPDQLISAIWGETAPGAALGMVGLSAADYEILMNLSEAPTACMRSFELCESTQWEKSRLSHHLKRIKQRGLVNREPTKNARLPAFMPTESGQAAITDAAPAHASNVHVWFIDAIRPERLTLFTQDCGAACAALDKHEETEARKLAGCDTDVPQIPFDRQHTMTARNVL